MPRFPPRSILMTRIAAISSRSRGSARYRNVATDSLNTMLGQRNRRNNHKLNLKAEHYEFQGSKGRKALGSRGRRRRGRRRCGLAFGSIAIATARESVEAG